MNVLLVDPNEASVSAVVTTLERVGHKVDVCSRPELAVAQANAQKHHCAIVDWMMPNIDGIELTRELKAESSIRFVVMLSELAQPEARAHAMRAGVDAYVVKPFIPAALVAAVRMGETRMPPQLAPPTETETRLMRHGGWARASGLARDCFVQACNLDLAVHADVGLPPQACEVTASLGMMDIGAQLEIHATLTLTRASGQALVDHMLRFKAADDEMIAETLTELSNNLLGQLKVSFHEIGHDFTLSVGNAGERAPLGVLISRKSAVLVHKEIQIGVELALRPVRTRCVPAAELSENMVLGEDLTNSAGALLLRKGTRLTSVIAARVKGQLGNREVRVASVGL